MALKITYCLEFTKHVQITSPEEQKKPEHNKTNLFQYPELHIKNITTLPMAHKG